MRLAEFIQKTTPIWKGVTETAELDVSVLIAHLLGKSRPWVLSHGEYELSSEEMQTLEQSLRRYKEGIPLPYLLGRWEFYGNEFIVTQATLIPRPETEMMVEQVLLWLREHPQASQVLDIGTGTGCIAISIALSCNRVRVVASDLSLAALRVAKQNIRKYALGEQVILTQSSLIPPLASRFDVICANLPYIPSARLKSLPIYGREPTSALDGGEDGLALYRAMFPTLPAFTKESCLIICEMDSDQSSLLAEMAKKTFPEAQIAVLKDLNGQDRLLRVELRECKSPL